MSEIAVAFGGLLVALVSVCFIYTAGGLCKVDLKLGITIHLIMVNTLTVLLARKSEGPFKEKGTMNFGDMTAAQRAACMEMLGDVRGRFLEAGLVGAISGSIGREIDAVLSETRTDLMSSYP